MAINPRISLRGDIDNASELLPFAKSKLRMLKKLRYQKQQTIISPGEFRIFLSSANGQDFIDIYAKGGRGLYVICYVGDSTIDFTHKKYYRIIGNKLLEVKQEDIERAIGKKLVDDGLYDINWDGTINPDPYHYTYNVDGGGIGIPAVGGGIPAKYDGSEFRYILTENFEKEFFHPESNIIISNSFNVLRAAETLSYVFYNLEDTNGTFNRYVKVKKKDIYGNYVIDDKGDYVYTYAVVFNNLIWGSSGTTLYLYVYFDVGYEDYYIVIPRIYIVSADGTKDYMQLDDYSDTNYAIIGGMNYSKDMLPIQKILRPNTWNDFGDNRDEPIRIENYDMENKTFTAGGITHRCSNSGSNTCWMLSPSFMSGTVRDSSQFTTNTGFETISNDVKLPYGITEDEKMDYVRIQKHLEPKINDITDMNTGVYCADTLVEETGYKSVLQLFKDNEVAGRPAGVNCPVMIVPARYRILQSFHNDKFDMVFYRKNVYSGNSITKDLPYYASRNAVYSYDERYPQLRKTLMQSALLYNIYVNGKITELDYKCNFNEYVLSSYPVNPISYTGMSPVYGAMRYAPWLDVNYDDTGKYLNEDDYTITRIFADATGDKLIVGFDIYALAFRHNLTYISNDQVLYPSYDETIKPFVPASDTYNLYDRKWLLFNIDGSYQEIETPQKNVNGVNKNWERINGMCII